MKKEELQACVIESLIVRSTLDGAFQCANIYRKTDDILTVNKKHFRDYLAYQLKATINRILMISEYTDNHHFETISELIEASKRLLAQSYSGKKHCRLGT